MEAFGEIGLLPWDFYRMSTDDYVLMQKGFGRKRDYEKMLIRRLARIIISPWVKGNIDESGLIPVQGDEERKNHISDKTLQTLQKLRGGGFSYVKVTEVVNGKKVTKIVEVPNKAKEN